MAIKSNLAVLLTFWTAVSLLAGCKKDPASGTHRVKTETTTSPSGVAIMTAYTYDSLGRQSTSKEDTTLITYTYSAGYVTRITTLAGDNFTDVYTLSSAGFAIADAGYTYTYDNNGYRLSANSADGSDTTVYTIINGNDSSAVSYQRDVNTVSVTTTAYTYYPNPDYRQYGLAFLGTPNTNLIKTQSINQLISGSVYAIVYTYTYSFDQLGRVTQMVKTSGSDTYTTTYTYY